jgi:hypothetical protein
MQIKTTPRFHLTPVRIAIREHSTTTGVGEDVVKKEHSYTLVGMQVSTTTLENNREAS